MLYSKSSLKTRLISLTLVILTTGNSLAFAEAAPAASPSPAPKNCPSAVNLNVGDRVTDCPRVGVSKDTMTKINQDLVTGDYNKQIADEQTKVIQLKDLQIADTSKDRDLWKAEADRERAIVTKQDDKTNWSLWGGIIAGIALTALGGWAVGQVHK